MLEYRLLSLAWPGPPLWACWFRKLEQFFDHVLFWKHSGITKDLLGPSKWFSWPSASSTKRAIVKNHSRKVSTKTEKFIFCWKRFIDDIFVIWTGTRRQLSLFYQYLNNTHHSIKFVEPQNDPERNSCNFLDLEISITNSKIQTDVYKKPTDNPSASLRTSSHPKHVTKRYQNTIQGSTLNIYFGTSGTWDRIGRLRV